MQHFARSSSIPLALASLFALCLAPVAIVAAPAVSAPAASALAAPLTTSCTMTATTSTVSLSAGGSQFLTLNTTPAAFGVYPHLMGSISGTNPGVDFNGWHVPLNIDRYFFLAWGGRGPFLHVPTSGFDMQGNMTVEVRVPAGYNAALAGRTLNHVFTIYDPLSLLPDCMSNAVSVTFVP